MGITRRMSVTGILLTPLLLVALCSAAPYEVQSSTSAPAVGAPEKLVEAVRSVHCSVQYVTIWDTKYEEQPFEVCETVYQQLCEVKSQRLCQNTTREECFTTYKKVCVDEYKTVLEPYTETECVTTYKEDCEYHWEVVGKEKVWAPIPGSCTTNVTMLRRLTPSKLPTLFVTRFQRRNVTTFLSRSVRVSHSPSAGRSLKRFAGCSTKECP